MASKKKRHNRFTRSDLEQQQARYGAVGFAGYSAADPSIVLASPQLGFETMQGLAQTFHTGKTPRLVQRTRDYDGMLVESGDGEFDATTNSIRGKRTQGWYLKKIADGSRQAKVRVIDAENNITFPDLPLYLSLRPQAGPVLPDGAQKGKVVRMTKDGRPIVQTYEDRTLVVSPEVSRSIGRVYAYLRGVTGTTGAALIGTSTNRDAIRKFLGSFQEGRGVVTTPNNGVRVRAALEHIERAIQGNRLRFPQRVGDISIQSILPELSKALRSPELPVSPNKGRVVSRESVAKALATREANLSPTQRALRDEKRAEQARKAAARQAKFDAMSPEEQQAELARRAKRSERLLQANAGRRAIRSARAARTADIGPVVRGPATESGNISITNNIEAPPAPVETAAQKKAREKAEKAERAASTAAARASRAGTPRKKRDNAYTHYVRDNGLVDGFTSLKIAPAVGGLAVGGLLGVPAANFVSSKSAMAVKVAGGVLGVYGLAAAASRDGVFMDRVKIAPSNDTHRSLLAFGAIGLALPMLLEGLRSWATDKLPAKFAKIGLDDAPAAPAAGFGSIYDFAGTGMYESVNPVEQLEGYGSFGEDELEEIDDVDPALEGLSAYVSEALPPPPNSGMSGFGEYVQAKGLGQGVEISVPSALRGLGQEIDPEEMFAFEGLGAGVTVTAGNALMGTSIYGGVAGLGTEIEGAGVGADDMDDMDDDDLEDLSGLGEADMDDEDLDLEGLGAVARRRSAARRMAASGRATPAARAAASAKLVRMTPATINKIASSGKMRRVVSIRVLRKSTRVPNTFIVAIGKSRREAVPAPGAIRRKPDVLSINPAPTGQERFQPGGVFAENVFGKRII
jgi:hypothetical protein